MRALFASARQHKFFNGIKLFTSSRRIVEKEHENDYPGPPGVILWLLYRLLHVRLLELKRTGCYRLRRCNSVGSVCTR